MMDYVRQPLITASPVYRSDRRPLTDHVTYDFSDYGFVLPSILGDTFEIIPVKIDEEEAFLFFFPREDIAANRYSLFNLHAFLKYRGGLEDFAHSRGQSVATIDFAESRPFGRRALTYDRNIIMRDLFKGAEKVIDFIGGQPDFLVRDSHIYFEHHHNHYYMGMIHAQGDNARYDKLRAALLETVRLV